MPRGDAEYPPRGRSPLLLPREYVSEGAAKPIEQEGRDTKQPKEEGPVVPVGADRAPPRHNRPACPIQSNNRKTSPVENPTQAVSDPAVLFRCLRLCHGPKLASQLEVAPKLLFKVIAVRGHQKAYHVVALDRV
jgi:hypothetical protein